MSVRSHAFKMAKEAFRWRYRKYKRSIKTAKNWRKSGILGHPTEPYDKERIKKLIRSVKHLDPRKVRLAKVEKPPGSRAPGISFVGKGYAADVKSMQIPMISVLERRKIKKQIHASVKVFLKKHPNIRKLSKKDRKKKFGFEYGGEVVIHNNVDRSLL